MSGMLARLMFGNAIAEGWQVNVGEYRFSLTEDNRRKGEVQFVDLANAKILTNCLDATADFHITTFSSTFRLFQRGLDAVGHENESGAALHFNRSAWMMS